MGKKHKPRDGSLAFYPRKRAKKQTRHFTCFKRELDSEGCKPLNFLAYKAGMRQIAGIDRRKHSVTANQQITKPVTVLEAPALKVFGIRAYGKTPELNVLAEQFSENLDKHLVKKLMLGRKGKEKKKVMESKEKEGIGEEVKKGKKEKLEEKLGEKKEAGMEEKGKEIDFNAMLTEIAEFRLLVHTQPYLTGIGKKLPDIGEVCLQGKPEEQLGYAQEKLGKELTVRELFEERDLLDVKAVTKGKGTTGVVKRFGVKIQGRKAKTARIVGAIGPWHPATVMYTVARAGQHGYQTRTEYNKKVLLLGVAEQLKEFNFTGYGRIKNDFVAVSGSVAGPVKRIVALRKAIRPLRREKHLLEEVTFVA